MLNSIFLDGYSIFMDATCVGGAGHALKTQTFVRQNVFLET